MGSFCTNCGSSLMPQAAFCTNCGFRQQNFAYHNPFPIKQKKKLNIWIKLAIIFSVSFVILGAAIFGVYKIGQVTGYWEQRQVARLSQAWQKQKGFKDEQSDMFESLDNFKSSLNQNNFNQAMNYVHPEQQEEILSLLTQNQNKIPTLISMLDNKEITFMSEEDSDYFYIQKFAFVRIGQPVNETTSEGTTIISMVKFEDRWVVENIQ